MARPKGPLRISGTMCSTEQACQMKMSPNLYVCVYELKYRVRVLSFLTSEMCWCVILKDALIMQHVAPVPGTRVNN